MNATITKEEIEKKVISIFAEEAGLSESEVSGETLIDHLNLDSLAIVEIVMKIEEIFPVEIPDEEIENFKLVGDATDYICKHT